MTKELLIEPGEIKERVAGFFSSDPKEFFQTWRGKAFEVSAYKKHVFIYCLWLFTDLKRYEIAELFNMDEKNVYHSVRTVRALCSESKSIKKQIIQIESMFE